MQQHTARKSEQAARTSTTYVQKSYVCTVIAFEKLSTIEKYVF